MDELAKNHEGDMSEKSTHIREYADKLALQEARANEFKEKMLRFAMNWQSFSQVSAFFSFYAQALPPSRPVSGLTNTGGELTQGDLQDTGGVGEAEDSED